MSREETRQKYLLFLFRFLAVALSIGAILSLLLLYRHDRIQSLVPLPAFLMDMIVKWAILPSLGFAVLDFLYGVFTGNSAKSPPKKAFAYLARPFQSRRSMALVCIGAGGVSLLAGWHVLTTPPCLSVTVHCQRSPWGIR